jgi:pentatricopeptide repeat protein
LIQQLPETMAGSVPPNFAIRLLSLAGNSQNLRDVLSDLKPLQGKIAAVALETVIKDAIKNKDVEACRRLHIIARKLPLPKSQQTYEALATAYCSDEAQLNELVEEVHVAAFRTPLPLPFAKIVLDGCGILNSTSLVSEVFSKVSSQDAAILRSIREKAQNSSGGSEGESNAGKSTPESNSPRNCVSMEGCPCAGVVAHKDGAASKDVALRANDIRSCGRNGDLKGAIKVLERLGGDSEHVLILNSILDACMGCRDLTKAFEYFDRARKHDLADIVSYNTMMKGYLAHGREADAKALLTEITQRGLTPTRASYHGLLNARVNAKDYTAAWRLVSDMQASGISPNAVTCSILLKGKLNSAQEVSRVLALIDAMEEPMDEVLFLSVVEACVRTGRLDSLSRQMGKFMKQSASAALTAPTYGSMIKAYGHARDVRRVWDLWNQMIAHRVLPTSVTLGCMVEALVANGCTSDAWKLTQQMWGGEGTQPLVTL